MPVPTEWDRQNEIILVKHVTKASKEYQNVVADFHQTQLDCTGFRICGCRKSTNFARRECS